MTIELLNSEDKEMIETSGSVPDWSWSHPTTDFRECPVKIVEGEVDFTHRSFCESIKDIKIRF